MKKIILYLIFFLGILITVKAQTKPALGAAAGFTLLAGTEIKNTDATKISGNIGIWPGNTLAGFPPGTITGTQHLGDATAQQAKTDLTNAYNTIDALPAGADKNLTGESLSGKSLGPGVYIFNATANLSGKITLDARNDPDAVFIFKVNGSLTTATNTVINVINNARRLQVFWQVSDNVTIGGGSTIIGSILAKNSIALGKEATVRGGRLLALDGGINLNKNNPVMTPTDLAVTITKSQGSRGGDLFFVGEQVTFEIVARNLGPNHDLNVVVEHRLNDKLTYISSTTSSSTPGKQLNNYDPLTGKWVLNELKPGEADTLRIIAQINKVGIIGNLVSILGTSAVIDENLNNNTSSAPPICATIQNPGEITGPATVCVGASATYSVAAVTGEATYSWIFPEGWEITSAEDAATVTVKLLANAEAGNVSVAVINYGCGDSDRSLKAVTLSPVQPLQPGPIQPESVTGLNPCVQDSETNFSYFIKPVAGAEEYQWELKAADGSANIGAWAIISGQGTTRITVKAGTNPVIISVKAVNTCGSSDARTLTITPAADIPKAPSEITGPKNPCFKDSKVVYKIEPVSGAVWYEWKVPDDPADPNRWVITAGDKTNSIEVTVGNMAGAIVVTAYNNCGEISSPPLAVTPSLAPAPVPGPITPSLVKPCQGTEGVTYSIAPVNGATYYKWTMPEDWTVLKGENTTQATVKVGATAGFVMVEAFNGCGTAGPAKLWVQPTLTVPGMPGPIKGTTATCLGTTNLEYTISPVVGAESYTWKVPADWKIDAGQGTATIKVTAGQQPGNVEVVANNACGSGKSSILAVTSGSAPAAPGAIVPNTSLLVCIGQKGVTYTVKPMPGAVSYKWELSAADWRITAGQGTTSITVNAGTQACTISVKAVNGCGDSKASTLLVTPASTAALAIGSITGPVVTCSGQEGLQYAVNAVPNATGYTWKVPVGWKITAGSNTSAITVKAGLSAGTISVVAFNNCARSPEVSLAVTVNPTPPRPGQIKELSTPCVGLIYAINAIPNATAYTWTVPAGWTITEGQGTTQIKVTAPETSKEGSVTVVTNTATCTSAATSLMAKPALGRPDLQVANVFSPNNDGINDTWVITNIQNYPDNELVLINRWGSEVYKTKSYKNNWTGDRLTDGTYYYVLKVKLCDGSYHTQKGYVMIMR